MMMKSYSFSKIDQFSRCPYSYNLSYLLKKESTDREAMKIGKIAHRILELGFTMRKEEIFNTIMNGKDNEMKDFFTLEKIFNELQPLITPEFYENCIAVELPFTISIGPYDIKGVIDRLDYSDHYKIIDYKYGKYEYKENNLENSLQLLLYSHFVMEKYAVDSVEVEYYNIRQRTKISRFIAKEEINLDHILSLISYMEMAEMMDDFPPNISGNCIYCSVRVHCEYFQKWINSLIPDFSPDISLPDMLDRFYDIQEREKVFRLQRMKLNPILQEITKMEIPDNYSIVPDRYGNLTLKKILK